MIRTYRIENWFSPREPEGTKTSSSGVTRTVAYDGTVKVVTWDFTEAVF